MVPRSREDLFRGENGNLTKPTLMTFGHRVIDSMQYRGT
jgi:hypothetical protein